MAHKWPVFLIGHGNFVQGVMDCVEMLAGKQEDVEVLPVFLEDNVDKLRERLDTLYKERNHGGGVLILVDMVGGTPWNLAAYLALSQKDVVVYAGFNISVLLEVMSNRKLPLDSIGKIIEEIHAQSCVNAADFFKEQGDVNNVG